MQLLQTYDYVTKRRLLFDSKLVSEGVKYCAIYDNMLWNITSVDSSKMINCEDAQNITQEWNIDNFADM